MTILDSEGWRCGRPGATDRCPPARLAIAVSFSILVALLLGAVPLIYLFVILPEVNSWLAEEAKGLDHPELDIEANPRLPGTHIGAESHVASDTYVHSSPNDNPGFEHQPMLSAGDSYEVKSVLRVVQSMLTELQSVNDGMALSLAVGGLIAMLIGLGMQIWACIRWGEAVRGLLLRGYCS